LLRAADLIGQLGDPHYLRKTNALYYEFEEIGLNRELGYESPADLVDKYPQLYWEKLSPYIPERHPLLERDLKRAAVDQLPLQQCFSRRARTAPFRAAALGKLRASSNMNPPGMSVLSSGKEVFTILLWRLDRLELCQPFRGAIGHRRRLCAEIAILAAVDRVQQNSFGGDILTFHGFFGEKFDNLKPRWRCQSKWQVVCAARH
jgi:hypothetical protein